MRNWNRPGPSARGRELPRAARGPQGDNGKAPGDGIGGTRPPDNPKPTPARRRPTAS